MVDDSVEGGAAGGHSHSHSPLVRLAPRLGFSPPRLSSSLAVTSSALLRGRGERGRKKVVRVSDYSRIINCRTVASSSGLSPLHRSPKRVVIPLPDQIAGFCCSKERKDRFDIRNRGEFLARKTASIDTETDSGENYKEERDGKGTGNEREI